MPEERARCFASSPGLERSSYVGRCYLVQGSALAVSGQTAEARSAFMSATEHLRPTLGAQNSQTRLAERLAVAADGKQRQEVSPAALTPAL